VKRQCKVDTVGFPDEQLVIIWCWMLFWTPLTFIGCTTKMKSYCIYIKKQKNKKQYNT